MARILCLAPSGFGKSTGIGPNQELGLRGLDPNDTYVISVTSKPLPFRGSSTMYKVATDPRNIRTGKRIISNDADVIAGAIRALHTSPFHNIVWDDANYVMQDWYMKNAQRTGWDAPKFIGMQMGKIFDAIELYQSPDKHIIVMAHAEEVKSPDGRVYLKMKTTGKMVDEYVTPEGKFDIVLLGVSSYDTTSKKVIKQYLTRETEYYSSAKSPYGMFSEERISNDLGYVVEQVTNYYMGEEPVATSEATQA
jgi:hypothetical protein